MAGRADAILIPEITYSIEKVAAHLKRKRQEGKPYSILVVAEGAKPLGGDVTVKSRAIGWVERIGGIDAAVAAQPQNLTGQESRSVVLGHFLSGGSPTAMDRNLGVTFGAGAVYALSQGMNGVMVALKPPRLDFVPLQEATAKLKFVPPDSEGSSSPERLILCLEIMRNPSPQLRRPLPCVGNVPNQGKIRERSEHPCCPALG